MTLRDDIVDELWEDHSIEVHADRILDLIRQQRDAMVAATNDGTYEYPEHADAVIELLCGEDTDDRG